MSEVDRILEQLRHAFEGNAWHGPAVLELLDTVTAESAAFRLAPNVHSIEELVCHMAVWKDVVASRIHGHAMDPTPDQDWSRPGPADTRRWNAAVRSLRVSHDALVDATRVLTDNQLDEILPGGRSRYDLLHGVVQHDLYHAGQIAVLVKLATPRG